MGFSCQRIFIALNVFQEHTLLSEIMSAEHALPVSIPHRRDPHPAINVPPVRIRRCKDQCLATSVPLDTFRHLKDPLPAVHVPPDRIHRP